MAETKYTKEHEWIRLDGGSATVGITDYAQKQLGDIVYVELPAVGRKVTKGGDAAVVESVKAASEVYAPISGEVTAINGALGGNPGLVNSSPDGEGWLFKLKPSDLSEIKDLMDRAGYAKYVEGLA
jgi:glycine cleavage system H protein